jgi:hypothetical protein
MSHEYTLIIYTSPVDGREDDYNAWYDGTHLVEFAALPGVIAARRFKVAGDGKPQYAALYELSTHPDQVLAAMNEAIKNGTMHMSDAVDSAAVEITTLVPR